MISLDFYHDKTAKCKICNMNHDDNDDDDMVGYCAKTNSVI